jgi:hypothetical protein
MFANKFILGLVGVWLARAINHVTENFNESQQIGAALINCFIFSVGVIPIVYLVAPSNPNSSVVLSSLLISYIAAFTLCSVYAKRFYYILFNIEAPTARHITPTQNKSVFSPAEHYNLRKSELQADVQSVRDGLKVSAASIESNSVLRRELADLNMDLNRYLTRFGPIAVEALPPSSSSRSPTEDQSSSAPPPSGESYFEADSSQSQFEADDHANPLFAAASGSPPLPVTVHDHAEVTRDGYQQQEDL